VASEPPVLYHLAISHYSEKVRWAFSYKGVRHIRRATTGGMHVGLSLWLTRGESYTLPVLRLDDRVISDSTRIVEALEHAFPDRALYPADPDERERALALEDHFDEELGPYIRRFAFAELSRDPDALGEVIAKLMPPPMNSPAIAGVVGKPFVRLRYGAGPSEGAEEARERTLAAFDRLEAELNGNEFLVGDSFTVADLTAAALFYPAVLPPEGPDMPQPTESLMDFRAEQEDRPGYRWVQKMYSEHRGSP